MLVLKSCPVGDEGYGYYAVSGTVSEIQDFRKEVAPTEVIEMSPTEVSNQPFAVDQIKYWAGPEEEMVRFIKNLRYTSPDIEMDRALF